MWTTWILLVGSAMLSGRGRDLRVECRGSCQLCANGFLSAAVTATTRQMVCCADGPTLATDPPWQLRGGALHHQVPLIVTSRSTASQSPELLGGMGMATPAPSSVASAAGVHSPVRGSNQRNST